MSAVPPTAEEWGLFISQLQEARNVQAGLVKAERKPEFPDALKRANLRVVEHAMVALLELLHERPEIAPNGLDYPFAQLANALAAVNAGGRPPLLEPVIPDIKPGKKSPATKPGPAPSQDAIMALSAIALDCLIKAGVRLSVAANGVARVIEAAKLPVPLRAGVPLTTTVTKWRQRLSQGPGPETRPGALKMWKAYKLNPTMYGPTPAMSAENIFTAFRTNEAFRW